VLFIQCDTVSDLYATGVINRFTSRFGAVYGLWLLYTPFTRCNWLYSRLDNIDEDERRGVIREPPAQRYTARNPSKQVSEVDGRY